MVFRYISAILHYTHIRLSLRINGLAQCFEITIMKPSLLFSSSLLTALLVSPLSLQGNTIQDVPVAALEANSKKTKIEQKSPPGNQAHKHIKKIQSSLPLMSVYGYDAYCVWHQAAFWKIDPVLLLAILQQEKGVNGKCVKNKNGTCDIGPAGINNRPAALKELAQHMGHGDSSVKEFTNRLYTEACFNVGAGAAMLRKKIDEAGGDVWKGVAWYNSRTPHIGQAYAKKVANHYWRIDSLLQRVQNTAQGV